MKEPQKILLRRIDVLNWTGITLCEFKKLVKAQVIKGQPIKGKKKFFHKEHIRAVLIKPFENEG